MDDRLQLITAIYNRPALWNIESEEYKSSRAHLTQLWQEVAALMGPDVTVEDCKRKWKYLRDAYRAELKRIEIRIEKDILNSKYNPKNEYSSKWCYFENMKFIRNIKRPRCSKNKEYINQSSNDSYDVDDIAESDEFSDFHYISDIKREADEEMNAVASSLKDNTNGSHVHAEPFAQQIEKPQLRKEKSSERNQTINFNQNSSKLLKTEDKPCCKCPKRPFDQMHFLEDLEKEEENLIKSTRLDISRSNDLAHVGDSDYNFLVSFLPQLKKMSELQNLQFRAKMTEFVLMIMSQPVANNEKRAV